MWKANKMNEKTVQDICHPQIDHWPIRFRFSAIAFPFQLLNSKERQAEALTRIIVRISLTEIKDVRLNFQTTVTQQLRIIYSDSKYREAKEDATYK